MNTQTEESKEEHLTQNRERERENKRPSIANQHLQTKNDERPRKTCSTRPHTHKQGNKTQRAVQKERAFIYTPKAEHKGNLCHGSGCTSIRQEGGRAVATYLTLTSPPANTSRELGDSEHTFKVLLWEEKEGRCTKRRYGRNQIDRRR